MSDIQHFLLVFDHHKGVLVDTVEFGSDSDSAIAQYQELERANRELPWMDIVLVGADSLDTVKVTHRNYFETTTAMSDIGDSIEQWLAELGITKTV